VELSCHERSISELETADAARFVGAFGSAPKLDRLAQPRIVTNENRKMCLIMIEEFHLRVSSVAIRGLSQERTSSAKRTRRSVAEEPTVIFRNTSSSLIVLN